MWAIESDTEKILKGILAGAPFVPAQSTIIGNSEVEWWEGKPGDAVVMASGGSSANRWLAEQIVAYQLAKIGYKRAQFTFDSEHRTGGWPDIEQKAKRLIQSSDVTLLRNGWNNIVAHVVGDHGEYTCEIGRDDPESRSITTWQCECPWDQYAWQRTRKWKKYEGRPCAHVLAAFWKSQATPLDEGPPEGSNLPPGQKGGPPPTPIPQTPALPTGPGGKLPDQMPSPDMPRSFGPEEALGESAPMAPPGEGTLPTPPMDQLAEQVPPVPGQTPGGMPANPSVVSVPGAKMPSPFNPIQFPGGTYSSAPEEPPNYRKGNDKEHCGNCKMNDNGSCWGYGNKRIESEQVCDSWYPEGTKKQSAEEFVAPEIVRLKYDGYGMAEGKSEAHGAGQYMNVPAGSEGEVLGQDPTTGWVEVIFPLKESSYLEPYHVKIFCEPSDIEHTNRQPPGPFVKRR